MGRWDDGRSPDNRDRQIVVDQAKSEISIN